MNSQKGFSIIEISLVSILFVGILSVGLPFGINAYRNYLMTYEIRNVATILRHAQVFAITNTAESDRGVAFLTDQMVLFRGSTYSTRNQSFDEIYPRSMAVALSAPDEIIFQSLSGSPVATSSIILGSGSKTVTININNHGVIDW